MAKYALLTQLPCRNDWAPSQVGWLLSYRTCVAAQPSPKILWTSNDMKVSSGSVWLLVVEIVEALDLMAPFQQEFRSKAEKLTTSAAAVALRSISLTRLFAGVLRARRSIYVA